MLSVDCFGFARPSAAGWLVAVLAVGAGSGCKDDAVDAMPDATSDDGGAADESGDTGVEPSDDESGIDETGGEPPGVIDGVGPIGMRRLTRYEFDNVVNDLLGDASRPSQALLPEEERAPFDNEYERQLVTQPLVDGIEVLARNVAQDLVADVDRRAMVVGCDPSGSDDAVCMREFVTSLGRLALRRTLAEDEVDDFVALGMDYADQGSDFFTGVEVVVRALLQDSEFVYRIEVGSQVPDEPGLFTLNNYELATRMSFLLWGSTPDGTLLDAAEDGTLDTSEGISELAAQMLADSRARSHVDRFHSLWLGYSQLPHPPPLTDAMRIETAALIERVVFEDQSSWLDIFTATETYIDATLAENYGLPAPTGGADWVDYGDSGRMGLMSHGSFLSVASNVMDTSPTKRGAFIRDQVMCMPVPPPPPDVMVDNPPEGEAGECKIDRYAAHRTGTCAACHEQMDYVGFGLENYDRQGRFRDHDEDLPQCEIAGEGEVVGIGEFSGPAELSQLLIDGGVLQNCVAQQLLRYALGREPIPEDLPYLAAVNEGFADADLRFDALLLELVSHDAFRYRRLPEED